MNPLIELQNWYAANCDEEWEHSFGVQIETLDNPGWSLTIDLLGTNLEEHSFAEIKIENADDDWYFCWVKDNQFLGAGDANKLEQLINVFLTWAKSENKDWLQPKQLLPADEQRKKEDQEFYAQLGSEVLGELCRQDNCQQNRIKNSVMCRAHHFEMIRKYPYQPKTT